MTFFFKACEKRAIAIASAENELRQRYTALVQFYVDKVNRASGLFLFFMSGKVTIQMQRHKKPFSPVSLHFDLL